MTLQDTLRLDFQNERQHPKRNISLLHKQSFRTGKIL